MSNQQRGCGKKKENSFYIETGPRGSDGLLNMWTWLLGDGLNDVLTIKLPPRGTNIINLAATIATGELTPYDVQKLQMNSDEERHMIWLWPKSVPMYSLADHVGKNNYTPWSFHCEAVEMGISRKISKKDAEKFAKFREQRGSLPILFTHSKMPLFRNQSELDQMGEIIHLYSVVGQTHTMPTYKVGYQKSQDNETIVALFNRWSMYAMREDRDALYYNGYQSFMRSVIQIVDFINLVEDDDGRYEDAKKFISNLRYVEQPFGLTWANQLTYTLPEDGTIDRSIVDSGAFEIVDLKEENETVNL